MMTREERFWSHVLKRGPDDCWEWCASKDNKGYGRFDFPGNKTAHRYSYFLANGPIPALGFVLHKCDNPSCVNPNHLEIGTQLDNMRDASIRERCNPAKGEASGMSLLTEEQVRQIRSLYKRGDKENNSTSLGIRFKTNPSTIIKIVNRRLWKHLQ